MTPKRITVHCSASRDGEPVPVGVIREWHKARGWTDIGYHFVIQPNGSVEPGRPVDVQGAHVEGHNEDNLGVCLVGFRRFSREQWAALRTLLDAQCLAHGIRPWSIFLHSEFDSAQRQGKTCPNVDPKRFLSWYLLKTEEPIWSSVLP